MSSVRLLVGTRKGAFVLTSDGTRKDWKIAGPHFPGWELYHLKGSPADPNRIYASQCWTAITHDLPPVLSVETQTLP